MRAVIIFPTEEPTMRPCFCFAIKIKNSRLTYIVICKEQYFKIVIILPFVTFFQSVDTCLYTSNSEGCIYFLPFQRWSNILILRTSGKRYCKTCKCSIENVSYLLHNHLF